MRHRRHQDLSRSKFPKLTRMDLMAATLNSTTWLRPATAMAWQMPTNIRIGAQTGDPRGLYCASLGHKQDDESGLIYMRARYYEPITGRFISSDPDMQHSNLF